MIAVSGPDGAGKTATVRRLVARLRARGYQVRPIYLYGCVVCRRVPERWALTDGWPGVHRLRPVARLHALVDALELAVRLGVLLLWARWGAHRTVVADRGALDGYAKHLRVAGPLARWCYRRLARAQGVTIWLDAAPTVLAARDGDHPAAHAQLARERFVAAAAQLSHVIRVPVGDRAPVPVADEVETVVLARLRSAG